VGPFGLGNGGFNSYVIDLNVVVSVLSLGIKIGVGTSRNCEDCAVGREGIELLWRLLDLWLRWWWWIGFDLDLGSGVTWH
jgi:hypothetical protein